MEKEELKLINEYIKRIAEGDESALELLYCAIGARMQSVAFGVLRDRGLSEDCLQESFLKIVKNASQFRLWQNGYGWACTIAKNTALNMLKQRRGRGEVSIDDFFDLSDNPDAFTKTDLAITVETAMARLDERGREAVRLKYFEELTVRQIAKRTGSSKSAVARLITAAENELKRYFT